MLDRNIQAATSIHTASAIHEDRSQLLRDAAQLSMEAAHGAETANDQQIGQILGSLVRTKLLSADDSYKLRDRLMDSKGFERNLGGRIEAILKLKGILTVKTIEDLRTRLQTLESKSGRA